MDTPSHARGSRRLARCFALLALCVAVTCCGDGGECPRPWLIAAAGPWLPFRGAGIGDLSHKRWGSFTLPQVSFSGVDPVDVRRWVAPHSRCSVFLGDNRAQVDGVDDAPDRGPERWQSLRGILEEWATSPRTQAAGHFDVLLRADRSVSWSEFRSAIEVIRGATPRVGHLQFAVYSAEPGYDGRIDSTIVPSAAGSGATAEVTLTWTGGTGPHDWTSIYLALKDRVWEFPAGPSFYWRPRDIEAANENWGHVAEALSALATPTPGVAELRVTGYVPCAHVIETFSLLLQANIPVVMLPDASVTLRLALPPPMTVRRITDPDPDVWPTAVPLGIGALAAVAAFALGRWTLRGRPRRITRTT